MTEYNMILSTTEPNNNVGIVKLRHADVNSQAIVAQIVENGQPKSFEGLQPFFCLLAQEVNGQGVSEESIVSFDAKKGTLTYTASDNALQFVGRNEAYFSFRKQAGDQWVEQFSTRSFHYIVEKSIYSQPFKDSNYWWTFKELNRIFNQYIEDGKKSWEEFLEANREILESIDPGGNILSELIRSRKPEGYASAYPDLPARLDQQIGKTTDFRSFEQDKSFMARVFNESAERGLNVKWFGAVGDGVTDDTKAIQDAIDYAFTTRMGFVFVPPGKYLISKPIRIYKRTMRLEGVNCFDSRFFVAPNFNDGQSFSPILKIEDADGSSPLDNITVSKLGFDATNDTVNTRGIWFENLIYTCSFEFLYFDSFSGSVMRSERVAGEMISFNQIRVHPKKISRVEETMYFTRLAESTFTNNRLFAKENGYTVDSPFPGMKFNNCSTINLVNSNSFFYHDSAPAIKIVGNTSNIGGYNIEGCLFENNKNEYTISVEGEGSGSGALEAVNIHSNFSKIAAVNIYLNNLYFSNVQAVGLGKVVLDGSSLGNTIEINSFKGSKMVDNTTNQRNVTIDIYSDTYNSQTVRIKDSSGQYSALRTTSAGAVLALGRISDEVIIRYDAGNGTEGNRSARVLLAGVDVGRFTRQGFIPFVKTTTGAPPIDGTLNGSMCINTADNKLYVFINGWKSISLV
ncbi:BppU family phage baseplate upper protein [Pseudolactococcus chungangensis]|uniref:BppU family phage baseplate upper protein n=1 Tax=Pseudolactococcus chungangensis TaxID=451457 RepID=UPI003FA1F5B7